MIFILPHTVGGSHYLWMFSSRRKCAIKHAKMKLNEYGKSFIEKGHQKAKAKQTISKRTAFAMSNVSYMAIMQPHNLRIMNIVYSISTAFTCFSVS